MQFYLLVFITSMLFGGLAVCWIKAVNSDRLLHVVAVSVILDLGHSIDTLFIISSSYSILFSIVGGGVGSATGLLITRKRFTAPS